VFCYVTRRKGLKQYSFYAHDQFTAENDFVKKHPVSLSAAAHLPAILPLNTALVPWVYRVRCYG
jgi:hypothetical protein